MRYGEGWAFDSTHGHYKRANQLRLTRKMTGMQIRHYQCVLHQRPMIQERMVASGSGRTVARSGRTHLHLQDIGGQESDTRGISRVQLATLQKPAQHPMFSEAVMKRKAMQREPLAIRLTAGGDTACVTVVLCWKACVGLKRCHET